MRFSALPGLLLLTLAACTTYAPAPVVRPNLDLIDRPPIALDVSRIEISDAYQPPMSNDHVDHLFPTPPLDAVHQWVTKRLIGVSNSGTATVTIKDAGVIAVPLQRQTGFFSSFRTQNDVRYDGHIEVEITIRKSGMDSPATTTALVTRSATALEGISVARREMIWNRMTQDMIHDLDARLESGLRGELGRYVVR